MEPAQPMTEEEELQAALMARKAQRAEILAAERQAASHTADQATAKPKPVPVARPAQQTSVSSAVPALGRKVEKFPPKLTNNKRVARKFRFEWDANEDTYGGTDRFLESNQSYEDTSNKLIKLVDERSSRNGKPVYTDVKTKPLSEMTERDWHIIREEFSIKVRGGPVAHPCRSWDEMNLPPHLRQVVSHLKFGKPTPIQMQAVPIGLGPFDVVGVAETGSGKTLAFVMPLLVRLSKEPWLSKRKRCADDGPIGLILGPTRELVNQIDEEVRKLGALDPMPIRSCSVIGGISAEEQGFRLREGCDVVVATPGRLIDLLASHVAVLNQCAYIVLDEADRMIDMGFEPQVNKVIDTLVVPSDERTTFLFSATMPREVVEMSKRYLKPNHVVIRVGDENASKNTNIDQFAYVLPSEHAKEGQLLRILAKEEPPIIIFCNSKQGCDILIKQLRANGKSAVALHGGRNQEEREENYRRFKEGIFDILVATDVAGRGLDIEGVSHVINYDCPLAIDRYTHRIGRTGRAGRSGRASTFIVRERDDMGVVNDIAKYMRDTKQRIPPEMEALLTDTEGLIEE